MKNLSLTRCTLSLGSAAALFAGCGASQPPIGAPGLIAQTSAIATQAAHGGSWMLPEAKSQDLLYISDFYGVHVFSYPKGVHVGDIGGFASPEGLCSDRAGNVFITDDIARHVYEYAHGGTSPINVLYDNYIDFNPFDCSVDPTTGNVAVATPDLPSIVIFPDAQNRPIAYSDPYSIIFWCAYDDQGNLFVERVRHHRKFYIGELPKGATKFRNLLLDARVADPSALKFDGRHVVVEDLNASTLYQLRFSGSSAIVIGTTALSGAKQIEQFWIQNSRVIGPDAYGSVYFWKYPAGGSPVKSIQGFTLPDGSTVSLAPN
ncbi:MAG TPA: hypothetical protein VFE35_06865 [Candidatus Cybelea sp.]|jgi:YD repeat-containing protein|nr:hypothetical protein [Candidatus Cybelea sp.]